jgi:hypothetical protein
MVAWGVRAMAADAETRIERKARLHCCPCLIQLTDERQGGREIEMRTGVISVGLKAAAQPNNRFGVGALPAALQFQTRIDDLTNGDLQDRRIAFRVGINIGDVIVEPHDIFGDGLNIAARLESIAEPGGICISSSAYEHVRGKVGVEFADLGEQNLKNIALPVRAYAVVRDGTGSATQAERARLGEAVGLFLRGIEANRNYPLTHFGLAATLSLLGELDQANAAAKAGLAINSSFTIRRYRDHAASDNPIFLAGRERIYEGLRLAGIPEG